MNKKMQKGILAVLIANVINVIFSLATNFLLPKYLPVESYAGIKEFQLYVSYVGLLHFGFVDGIYLKYGGKTLRREVDSQFTTDLSTMLVFQLFITVCALGIATLLNDRILMFFAVSILPQNMNNYFKFLYQATGEFKHYGKAMNLTTISIFVVNMVLLLIFQIDNVVWYILGYVILYYGIWFLLEGYFRKNHILKNGKIFSVISLISNIKAGFLLTLGNLSSIFLTSMDRWFVKVLMNTVAFAQYSFAVSVENFLNLAITPVTTTLYNYFCCNSDVKAHRKVYNYIIIFATIVPAAAFPVKFILETFLTNYLDSTGVVFLLFSAQIFYIIVKSVYVNLYKVQRKQRIYFIKLVFILLLGFMFNCVCYTMVHVKEAFAVGTLLSAIVWYLISSIDFKYLKPSCKNLIYLSVELVMFLILGYLLPAIVGGICYIAITVLLMAILLNDTFLDMLKRGKKIVYKLKKERK